MLDLAFRPDRDGAAPLHHQLADYLRELIGTGRVAAGEKLPATRELAAALGIARNTANQAYQALVEDGALLAHVGQGTFVSSRQAARRPAADTARAFAWDGLVARAGRLAIPAELQAPTGPVRFDFRGGRVDADALPRAELRRAYAQALARDLATVGNEVDPLGHPPLRAGIARALVARGIQCEADDVLVTSGAQQALDLVCRVLIDPGDAVAVEQPGYFGITLALQTAGAQLVGIDVDDEGLRTDALARALRARPIKMVYVTPAAQMPTGVVLSAARRRALMELADETQTPVVEDDYDSEFRHGEPPLPALKTQDAAGQVIYVGTFSKAICPGLRLGYVVAARPLLARLALARLTASFGPDTLCQAAVAHLLATGALERHVRRLRRRYAERRAALVKALESAMPAGTRFSRPRGGLLLWVTLPPGVDAAALHRAARRQGIAYERGETCYADGRGTRNLALSFASLPPAAIREGIARLGAIARRQRAAGRSR